jgi:hypothetical protein
MVKHSSSQLYLKQSALLGKLLMRQEPMAQALLWSPVPAALAYVPGQAEAVHGDVTWALHSWQGAAGPSERS